MGVFRDGEPAPPVRPRHARCHSRAAPIGAPRARVQAGQGGERPARSSWAPHPASSPRRARRPSWQRCSPGSARRRARVLGFIYLFVFSLGMCTFLVARGYLDGRARAPAARRGLDDVGQARVRRHHARRRRVLPGPHGPTVDLDPMRSHYCFRVRGASLVRRPVAVAPGPPVCAQDGGIALGAHAPAAAVRSLDGKHCRTSRGSSAPARRSSSSGRPGARTARSSSRRCRGADEVRGAASGS